MGGYLTTLRRAAEAWVRAEWAFRHGPQAYRDETMRWYLDAEDALREALTGVSDLVQAARELGVKVIHAGVGEAGSRKRRAKERPKKSAPKRSREPLRGRGRGSSGLFENRP